MINESLNLLSKAKSLEPTAYDWEGFEAYLLPSKREITIPSEYTIVSGCNKGCKGRCNYVIVLKMMFLALSFVNELETVVIYKCAMLMCNSFYFSQYFCSFFNFS